MPEKKSGKDPDLVVFGANLRAARQAAGLTIEELADRAGMNWSYVSQCERGERNATIGTLLRLARALNIQASQLLP